ncbi:Oidioi.mRNA.OKI2018_I69.PAR.g8963.t3.cds [Oikopleura dioica]|uniref:Oidioi.mRNA.OKI2018_I69.PAR.g8963.t3.cds n=1 Tax=Oikopleura dioica TaxID=34765 RepID=A0ABN7RIE3_OIKDI|nr:Oidioi.mRNA.OKI2018_I69.PAR.g8963.t3.cds [Oikopleura dioica]
MMIQIFVLLLFQSVISISERHLREKIDGEYRIIHDYYAEVDSKRKRRSSLLVNQTISDDDEFEHYFTFKTADSNDLRFAVTLDSGSDSGCKFYSGRVVGQDDSEATLSDCFGGLWSGMIHMDDELWILDHLEDSSQRRAHVIYRLDDDVNSVLSTKNSNSLVRDTFDFLPPSSRRSRSRRAAAAFRSSLPTRSNMKKPALNVTIEVTVGDDLVQHYQEIVNKKQTNDAAGREYSLEKYIDALMKYTNDIYKHSSLTSRFHFHRVGKVQKLEKRETDSIMSYNGAQETLMEFCSHSGRNGFTPFWEPGKKNGDGETKHASILLTRRPFGPAGMATIDKICSPNPYSKTECPGAIVIEEGVATAFVIAHELGHLLGIRTHDGDPGNACADAIAENSMMAAQVNSKFGSFTWSICSNRELGESYVKKGSQCLEKANEIQHRPGFRSNRMQNQVRSTVPIVDLTIFTADQQCQQTFGAEWTRCPEGQYPSESKFCQNLWCKTPQNPALCRTKDAPAESTPCPLGNGQEGKCFSGTCIGHDIGSYQRPGYFSNWSTWSTCNVECGTGTRLRTRSCSTGNSFECEGDDTDFMVCNTHECVEPVDKRIDACYKKTGNSNMIPFVPNHNDNPCHLSCKIYGSEPEIIWPKRPVREEDQWVPDGTFCDYRVPHGGICVQGKCQQVDCEGRRGGRKQVDECGVCGGDGSQCQEQRGAETVKGKSKKSTKRAALTIPANAYGIVLSIKARTRYYKIFFTDKQSNKEYQMWPLEEQSRRKRRVEFGHEAAIGGAQFSVNQVQSGHYGKSSRNRRKRSPRVIPSIRTEGQSHTVSEIQVEVEVTRGKKAKKGVRIQYQYNVHRSAIENAQNDFVWEHDGWKSCPPNDARGCAMKNRVKKPIFVCKSRRTGNRHNDDDCNMLKKPKYPRPQPCAPCPFYEWSPGKWGSCPINQCGDERYRYRKVYCRNGDKNIVDDYYCAHLPNKPAESNPCKPVPCTPKWHSGEYSPCSVTCGDGYKERVVECRRGKEVVGDEQCYRENSFVPERRAACYVSCQQTESFCIDKSAMCEKIASNDNFCSPKSKIAKFCCASCRRLGRNTRLKARLTPRYTYEDYHLTDFNKIEPLPSPGPNDEPEYYNSEYDSEEDIINPNDDLFSRKRRSDDYSSSFLEEYREPPSSELS